MQVGVWGARMEAVGGEEQPQSLSYLWALVSQTALLGSQHNRTQTGVILVGVYLSVVFICMFPMTDSFKHL